MARPEAISAWSGSIPTARNSRLIRVESANTGGAVGWCLDPADLAVAKLGVLVEVAAPGEDARLDFVDGGGNLGVERERGVGGIHNWGQTPIKVIRDLDIQ